MIWHIFKKDWTLLWPLAVIVAAGHFVSAALWIELGHFNEPSEVAFFAQLFSLAVFLGWAALVVALVHQDIVPGDRQDWLVRPIRRRDLLLAKLTFVLIVLHGPIVLANIIAGAVEGLPFGDTVIATLSSNAILMLVFGLALFGAATMTRTTTQVIGGTLAIVIVGVGADLIAHNLPADPFSSGMSWMEQTIPLVLAGVAGAVVIPLQYFRRATPQSYGVAAGLILLAIAFEFARWPQAFALQQWVARDQATAKPITIAFDLDFGKSSRKPEAASAEWLLLPLRVSGLAPDSFVMTDRAEVRLLDSRGTTLYRGPTFPDQRGKFSSHFPIRTATGGDVRTYQQVMMPAGIFDSVGDQPVRVEIEYSLTLFYIEATGTIVALDGSERMPGFGWCKSTLDDDGDEIEVGCLKAGSAPSCITAILENRSTGMRNPENRGCARDYSPAYLHFSALDRFGGGVHFLDPQGLAKYPVDGSQLADAQVILKSYRPVAHFTRHLVIPDIRLSDWAPTAVDGNSP